MSPLRKSMFLCHLSTTVSNLFDKIYDNNTLTRILADLEVMKNIHSSVSGVLKVQLHSDWELPPTSSCQMKWWLTEMRKFNH